MRLATVQGAYDKIMQERDALSALDNPGADACRRMALANYIEEQLPLRCAALAAEQTAKARAKGGLVQRFLRARNPAHGACSPQNPEIRTAALTEMVGYYESQLDAARFDPEKDTHTALLARQTIRPLVLEGSIAVKKPLQLKKPAQV